MEYVCLYCGKPLEQTSFEDYRCSFPACVNEYYKVRNGKLLTVDDLFGYSSRDKSDTLDVSPEDWRKYEDGDLVSWLPPKKRKKKK